MTTAAELGPYVRLWGLKTADLPAPDASPEQLAPFLHALLREAAPFIDTAAPRIASDPAAAAAAAAPLWKSKGTKTFPESTAPVAISLRVVPAADLASIQRNPQTTTAAAAAATPASEAWFCRRSVHADAAARGTASWSEFRRGFKEAHPATEDAFTPAVVGAREALSWECGAVEAEATAGERWGNFSLKVVEMRHKIGAPLQDRVFPVLQMTCSALQSAGGEGGGEAVAGVAAEKPEFLVVSTTVVDFDSSPAAELCRDKSAVVAAYASVERIRKLSGSEIEWIMATASDARGVLPQWVQNIAMPSQIAKDVPLYLEWAARARTKTS